MNEPAAFVAKGSATPDCSGTGFGLPSDLLRKSRRGIKIAGLLILLGSGLDELLLLTGLVSRGAGAGQLTGFARLIPLVGNAVLMALSVALIGAARSCRVRNSLLLNLALMFEILFCFTISVCSPLGFYLINGALPLLTWVTPMVILFPLLIPCPPRRTLITALMAAATCPLGLSLLQMSGRIEASVDSYLSMSFGPALAVVIAFYASQVVYGLGLNVVEARRMGNYQLERLLGRGGMGEVWLARHRMLARPAAVKLMRPELIGATNGREEGLALQRFEREAQVTAAMRSPHTVGLYDFGVTADGTLFYVMELLDGLNAESLVKQFGPIPAERAIHILRQICHSLAEAHEAGLIHRDIKPANVYVCRYGREVDFIKVLDFGLVKTLWRPGVDDVTLTAESLVCGTPAYMAPEQALGGDRDDARSDIYAVGCVAYWLLTGQLVFEGESSLEVLMHHARTPPTPPSQRTELPLPESLDRLILSCLEKDPARRPQSAAALSRKLAACAAELAWTEERAAQWWERHRPVSQVA
jgi:serine/threonine-protein kinase